MKLIDRTGERYGQLTVIKRSTDKTYPSGMKSVMWECKCDCGNVIVTSANNLRLGKTKSCGCKSHEWTSKYLFKHGDGHESRIYRIWSGMRQRCNNQNLSCYKHYGGRGIRMCSEWMEYKNFKEWALSNGYSDELTIDRIDVNGDYDPGNCRWATVAEQANNKRNNHWITIGDKTQTLTQWMRELNKNEYQILKTYC